MTKSVKTVYLLILLAGLVACKDSEPAPNDDILSPLPSIAEEGGEEIDSNAITESNIGSESEPNLPTLVELLSEDPNLVFFANSLDKAGLTDDLQNGGPFTVFAASNIAFSNGGLIVSQMDPALIGSVVDNHLVEGAFSEDRLLSAGSVTTLAGVRLDVTKSSGGGLSKIAYGRLAGETRSASNGVLYIIDSLLLPPETGPEKSTWGVLQADGRFSKFVSLMEGTDMMLNLRFNDAYDAILAPTDEAFANMPTNITNWLANHPHDYQYVAAFHLLTPDGWPQDVDLMVADLIEKGTVQTRAAISGSGSAFGYEEMSVSQTETGVIIGGAQIIEGDIDTSNSIVHVIDTVLVPPGLMEHIR